MESNKESCDDQTQKNDTAREIIKPDQQLQQAQQQEDVQLQQQQDLTQQHQEEQEVKQQKQIEIPREKQQEQPKDVQVTDYEEDDEDDDEDEKDTSQKLIIDIPDEEEEKQVAEEDDDDDDVILLEDIPQEISVNATKKSEKVFLKPQGDVNAIITLSDGEEDVAPSEAASKPGKIQKRRSLGAGSVASGNDEERFCLKRRKINVAGAPKLPLTGYLRYMNNRRESVRKEHPTKTSMEHTRIIGEEWHALSSDVKSSYLKAADTDKQRLF